jgi:hypothetical protein
MPFLYCLLALHAWGDIPPEPERLDEAMRAFQQVDRRIQPALGARLETMRAAAYARAGRPDDARAILAGVPRDSDDVALLWMRASAHVQLGDDSAAAVLLGEYLEKGGWEASRVAASRPFWRLYGGPPSLQRRSAGRTP